MFPELREAKPDNGTAAGMLARAVRHDLSSMAHVRAVTGTLDQWLAPVKGSFKPLFAFEGVSIMYRVDADGARRVRPWAGKNKEAGYGGQSHAIRRPA